MKDRLLDAIRAELRARFDRLTRAAKDAHAAATDPGSKAESKYDTRSLEASYLAAGQARQLEDLARDVSQFQQRIALALVICSGYSTITCCASASAFMAVPFEKSSASCLQPCSSTTSGIGWLSLVSGAEGI